MNLQSPSQEPISSVNQTEPTYANVWKENKQWLQVSNVTNRVLGGVKRVFLNFLQFITSNVWRIITIIIDSPMVGECHTSIDICYFSCK